MAKMYAIVTLLSGGNNDIPGAIALAKSARIFSQSQLVCMVTNDVTDIIPLQAVFDDIVEVAPIGNISSGVNTLTKWRILGLDRYKGVLFLGSNMIIISPIDALFLIDTPASVFPASGIEHGGVVKMGSTTGGQMRMDDSIILITPSKFAMDLFLKEITEDISDGAIFFTKHGYPWHNIDHTYDIKVSIPMETIPKDTRILHFIKSKPWVEKGIVSAAFNIWRRIYNGSYISSLVPPDTYSSSGEIWRNKLMKHLLEILTPILGNQVGNVLEKYSPIYQQCFISKKKDPIINYDLLEAYGDRFLKGQYVWFLLNTPGIITSDQVDKISSFFQNQYSLESICDSLNLTQFIILPQGTKPDTKTKSDVVEALIAATGISWQKMYKKGDLAMRTFIFKIYSSLFTIQPDNYKLLYEDPKTRLKNQVEELRLNRDLLKESFPQEEGGEILVTITYNGYTLGTGKVSLEGRYKDTAIKLATKEAYRDALRKNSLQSMVGNI